MAKDYYTCEEIAELMGIKTSTVRAYCKNGKIPSLKIGRSYHVSAKDFEEWCQDKKQVPADAEINKYIKKLRESEIKYKSLIDQSLDGILMTDFKSSLILVNPSFCKMLGYSEKELLGSNFTQYFHPEERAQEVEDHMRRIAGEIDNKPKTARLLKKDGKTVFAEILESPAREAGKVIGVQKIIRDITGRKRLEQELETILDLVPDALMITDFTGKIYRVNKSVEEFSGYTKEELLNMNSVINMYHYPEERLKAIETLKKKGAFHNFEFTANIKGTLMPGEMSAKVVEIGGEKYIESLVRDITERKQLQDELQKTKDTLEQAFNAVNFGISYMDANLRVIFTNDWLKENIPAIAVGEVCHIPFNEKKEICPWCPSVKCLESGELEKARAEIDLPNGKALKFDLRAYPVKDVNGKITHITETIIDRSEKERPGWDIFHMES